MSRIGTEPLAHRLVARIERYADRVGLSPARIATLAVNDGDFVRRLKSGGTCTLATFEKFMRWLDTAEGELVPEDIQ